jgi:hypothetical protein
MADKSTFEHIVSVSGHLTTILTVGGMLIAALVWGGDVWESIAKMTHINETRAYHDANLIEVLGPIQKSVEGNESAGLVIRLRNVLNLRCRTNTRDLDDLIDQLRGRYSELNEGRVFDAGSCLDGKRVTRFEMERTVD